MADDAKPTAAPAHAEPKPAVYTAAKPFQKIGDMPIDENGMDLNAAQEIAAKRMKQAKP